MSERCEEITRSVSNLSSKLDQGQTVSLTDIDMDVPVQNPSEDTEIMVPSRVETEINQNVAPAQDESFSAEDMALMKSMEKQLAETVGPRTQIDYETFKRVLKVKHSYFGERFFKLFDTDHSNTIEVGELISALRRISHGTPTDKLKFLFDVYDESGDGLIDIEELRTALRSCMAESSVKLSDEDLDLLTQALFEDADADNSGSISFDELRTELEKCPGVLENLNVSVEQWLKPERPKPKKVNRHFTKTYFVNNLRKILFFFAYLILNVILLSIGCFNYRTHNPGLVIARGAGLCLNFNCTFILVLMLRHCITWLRATPVCQVLPLDQHIMFHKLTGFAIVLFTVIHTFGHLGNAVIVSREGFNLTIPEFLFTTRANIGLVAGLAPLTGWVLDIILVIMVVCSQPFIRRSGKFEVFYWTHMLYFPFWLLLILHCQNFWKWFVVPGVIFILEKIFRSKLFKKMRNGNSYILEVNLLPSEVTHLVISRPQNLHFRPGDYLFIQIPAIATSEWHPFTISSAPEMEDKLWLHIRSAGHWTRKVYEFFNSISSNEGKDNEAISIDDQDTTAHKPDEHHMAVNMNSVKLITNYVFSRKAKKTFKSRAATYKRGSQTHKRVHIQCFLDGPYGTSSRAIFDTEHAVLISSGIGVTPYASILQSIMYRFKAFKHCCPRCVHSWYDDIPSHVMRLKKVDFIWINRDQKSFEWFVSLLTQLEMEQSMAGGLANFLEMHMFMTSALNKTDMKGIGLQMALDLIHKKEQKDLLTGLKTRTQPGRPNFQKLFAKIAAEKKGHVKVFFCGNPTVGKTIKLQCENFGFAFCKENF